MSCLFGEEEKGEVEDEFNSVVDTDTKLFPELITLPSFVGVEGEDGGGGGGGCSPFRGYKESNDIIVHAQDPLGSFPVPGEVPNRNKGLQSTTAGVVHPLSQQYGQGQISLQDFYKLMEENVESIVRESISLFQRDPREYHPFYLRVYKYIKIGKELGYVHDEDSFWGKYDKFAKDQFDSSTLAGMEFTGERSAYATYILTKKVIINDVLVKEKRNEKERQKQFRKLEEALKKIRMEWDIGGVDIRESLDARLAFFKECQVISYPADCIKMNNLWSKFLSGEVKSGRVGTGGRKTQSKEGGPSSLASSKSYLEVSKLPPRLSKRVAKRQLEKDAFLEKELKEKEARLPTPSPSPPPPPCAKIIKKFNVTTPINKNLKREIAQKWKEKKKSGAGNSFLVPRRTQLIKKKLIFKQMSDLKKKPLKATLEKILCKKLPLTLTPAFKKKAKLGVRKPEEKGLKILPSSSSTCSTSKAEKQKPPIGKLPISKNENDEENSSKKRKRRRNNDAKTSSPPPPENSPPLKIEPLQEETDKTPTPTASFICDECGLVTSQAKNLRAHKKFVHFPNRRTFDCPAPFCKNQALKSARALWAHYYRHHMSPDELPPEIQNLVSSRAKPSSEIFSDDAPSESTTCDQCGKEFANSHCLRRHIHTIHGDGLLKENRVLCPHCGKEFKEKVVMWAHVRRFHTMTEVIRCNICQKGYGSTGRLWKHKVDDHKVSPEEEATSLGVKYAMCEFCGEPLLQGRQTCNHVKTNHPEKFEEWWKLELTRRKLYKIESKREQRRKFVEEGVGPEWLKKDREYRYSKTCPKCNEKVRGNLLKHLKKVHNVKPDEVNKEEVGERWICPKEGCGGNFEQKRILITHLMESHCELEEKIVENNIIKFIGRSGPYKKYMCSLCGSYLYDRAEVRVHIVAIHPEIYSSIRNGTPIPTVEQTCPHCPSKFPVDHEVRSHVENDHPDLCWKCPECFKVMLHPDEMVEHFSEDHDKDGKSKELSDLRAERDRFMLIPNKRRKDFLEGDKLEMEKKRRAIYSKYQSTRWKCVLCKKSVSFCRLTDHLRKIHGIIENGQWTCPVCRKDTFTTRPSWLGHMHITHKGKINMEEMVKEAKKINTLEDWRTLKLKGIRSGSLGQDIYSENGATEHTVSKNGTPRIGQKTAANVKRLKTKRKKIIGRKRGQKRKNEDKVDFIDRDFPSINKAVRRKTSCQTRAVTKSRRGKSRENGGDDEALLENIEKYKRLVIRLVRL